MAQASRSGGLLPPLATAPPPPWVPPDGSGEEPWEERRPGGWRGLPAAAGSIPCLDPLPGGPESQAWWARQAPADASEDREAADWRREPAAGGPIPLALQRLRAVLLRLQRERQQLLRTRDSARHLQAVMRLLRTLSPGTPAPSPGSLLQLCGDLLQCPSRGPALRSRPPETLEALLLTRLVGLATQRLDAAIGMQLRALGRAPPGLDLWSQLSELLRVLPSYHQLLAKAASRVPGAARSFTPARVLRLLAGERGCQVADRLAGARGGLGLRDQLHRQCQEERELLPGLLGLAGGGAASSGGALGLGGAGALWSQYWTLLWAACARSLDLKLGPWKDPRAAAQKLSQALGQASLPQECEKELTSLCHHLRHQSLVWSWDQGFCRALGATRRPPSSLPASGDSSSCSPTAELLYRLFPPLLDALQEPSLGLMVFRPPALALGACTLQTTLLWLVGQAWQHLATWAPGSFLLLIQKDLPPLLREAQALCSLVSEGSSARELDQQLGREIQKLAAQIQLLSEEFLNLFSQECHKQAAQGFQLYMPRGRYWRQRLCPEPPSVPSDYAGLVVRSVLEPVLQGLQGLPPTAQAPALGQVLTAVLGAWLDHILAHGIRFSLQGALQLRQDFGVVPELLAEGRWGLPPDLRQTLSTLSVFQRLDGALLCLLQQPPPDAHVRGGPPCCCPGAEVEASDVPGGSLHSLENLEPPARPAAAPAQTAQLLSALWGGGPNPEAYLVGNQQAWLALRLHQGPRWHLPCLSCLGASAEH